VQRLYGRADVLSRVRPAIEATRSGRGRLLVFTGEPGIGKSSVAEHAAAEAASAGAAVAWGRCWEAGGAPAYWPWIQIFRRLEMPEDPFARAAPDLAGGAAEARFAAFDQAVSALKAAAAHRPLALVLDDLHAADAPSLLLLLLLAHELPRSPILVIGAYREAELRLTPEIAPLLARVAREAEVLPLSRLGAEDVAAWVGTVGAEPAAARAAELYRLTEGHPLFLVEALRLGGGAEARASVGLASVLDERLARLAPGTRALLEVAAVLGREFSIGDVAATAGTTADRAHEAVREAVATSIVLPSPEPERFRFSHVLLRDRLYAELRPSARAKLHFRAGSAGLARGADPRTVIHHLFEGQSAGPPGPGPSAGPPGRIAEVALAAAEASLARLAFEDAVRIVRRALAQPAGEAGPGRLQVQLQLVAAEALIRLGETGDGKALCLEAAALAARVGEAGDDLLARAALVYGTELASGTVDEQMIALLRQGLARLHEGDSPLRARVMSRLAAALTPPRNHADMAETLELVGAAMAMARRIGERHTLLHVLHFAATVGSLVAEEDRFAIMLETVELARALDQPLVLLNTLPTYITALLVRGERVEAEVVLAGYRELQQRFKQPIHRVRRALLESLFCALRGDFEASDRLCQEAQALSLRSPAQASRTIWLVHRLSLAQLRARPDLLADEAPAVLAHFAWMPTAVPYVAWLLASLGRREEAAARLGEMDLVALPIRSANLMDLMGAAEACVLLGDRDLAEAIYPKLVRAADRMFWNLGAAALLGPTARALGDLARLIGRLPEAVRHYDEAIAACEKLGAPPLIEICRARREAALAEGSAAPVVSAVHASSNLREPPVSLELRREGDLWAISSPFGAPVHVRHAKGVQYLAYLVEQPGRQVHVLELAGVEGQASDAGPVLDPEAKQAYRRRLDDLAEEVAEAERFGDSARVRRAEEEIDALAEQLAGAVGLGGRDRRAASNVERTRINVQRRLKDVVERVAAANPALGRYLGAAVKTGTYCAYRPI
jgi:tetratricopeptide (TPR) repeat protein